MDVRERLGLPGTPTQEAWDACFDESVYDVVLAISMLRLEPPAASVWRACLLHPAGMLEQFTKKLLELLAPGAFNAMVENEPAAALLHRGADLDEYQRRECAFADPESALLHSGGCLPLPLVDELATVAPLAALKGAAPRLTKERLLECWQRCQGVT